MSGEVIILTGPPGAGKTTVAELIAKDADVPTVHLTTDWFYRGRDPHGLCTAVSA